MKQWLQNLLERMGARTRRPLLAPAEFTAECAEALRRGSRDILVEIPEDLVLNAMTKDGRVLKQFLYLPYEAYREEPGKKRFFIQRVVATFLASQASPQTVNRSRIVPVVKTAEWLGQVESMPPPGAGGTAGLFWEVLVADLLLLYAEDSPAGIRYLSRTDLETAGIAVGDLRSLASKNLIDQLQGIKRQWLDGFYMITAGGDYESSLLLVDSLWNRDHLPVKGDFVIAVPARDLLLVGGSEDEEGISRLRAVARERFETGHHRLTGKLFLYKNGDLSEI
jgi:uncharacterized protein YtpQ (UPF0354 family)